MHLICESSNLSDYLAELEVVDYSHPLIQEHIGQLNLDTDSETERVKACFEFVRDSIYHSGDIQSPRVTCKASEVLTFGAGLCYAKSHLLAALLRAQGIPVGFCYQRLTLGETPETGHVLHGLNAVYLASEGRWIRLDARGNKLGVQTEFSTGEERVAFVVRPEQGELDYPTIYVQPHPSVSKALKEQDDCLHISLPDQL